MAKKKKNRRKNPDDNTGLVVGLLFVGGALMMGGSTPPPAQYRPPQYAPGSMPEAPAPGGIPPTLQAGYQQPPTGGSWLDTYGVTPGQTPGTTPLQPGQMLLGYPGRLGEFVMLSPTYQGNNNPLGYHDPNCPGGRTPLGLPCTMLTNCVQHRQIQVIPTSTPLGACGCRGIPAGPRLCPCGCGMSIG